MFISFESLERLSGKDYFIWFISDDNDSTQLGIISEEITSLNIISSFLGFIFSPETCGIYSKSLYVNCVNGTYINGCGCYDILCELLIEGIKKVSILKDIIIIIWYYELCESIICPSKEVYNYWKRKGYEWIYLF